MWIIGLSGKMGTGKDFIARNVVSEYLKFRYPRLNIYFFSFADPLKMQALEQYKLTWDQVYPHDGIPKSESVRKILQNHGNNKRREDPEYWIRIYNHWCKLFKEKGCDVLITPDVRFKNEREHIFKQGGIVCKVHAPSRTYYTQDSTLTKDVSENDLDSLEDSEYFHVFQNDKPFQDLSDYTDFFEHIDSTIYDQIK